MGRDEGNDEPVSRSAEGAGRGDPARIARAARDGGASDAAAMARATASEALSEARARLADAGVDDPLGDARRLLAFALDPQSDAPSLSGVIWSAPLTPAAQTAFDQAVAARAARRPVARITGRRAFFEHVFVVSDAVLDPRPESEALVAAALAETAADAPLRVLDLGVGSGCLLLSVLAARPRAAGVGVDVSAAALRTAAENAERLGVAARTRLLCIDWRDDDADWTALGLFDVILCNPPYISAAEMARLDPEVRRHDPPGALSPGDDALDAYRRLAPLARGLLIETGAALFEFGEGQAAAVARIFAAARWRAAIVRSDLSGRPRFVQARR